VAVSPHFNSRLKNGGIPVFQGGKIVNGSLPHWLVGPTTCGRTTPNYLGRDPLYGSYLKLLR
jgi:hypothetical protein